jgi:hypothetical protein
MHRKRIVADIADGHAYQSISLRTMTATQMQQSG